MNTTEQLTLKKQAFIDAYISTFGNISECCKACGIRSRTTFYNWMENDPVFKAEIEAIQPDDLFIDFAEDALKQRIRAGDTTAIIYALKSKGKKRGWGESSAVEHYYKEGFDIVYTDASSS